MNEQTIFLSVTIINMFTIIGALWMAYRFMKQSDKKD